MYRSRRKILVVFTTILFSLYHFSIQAAPVEPKIYFNNSSGNNKILNISVHGENNRAVVTVGNGMSTVVSSRDLNLSIPTTLAVDISVQNPDLSKTYILAQYQLTINYDGKGGTSTLVNCRPTPQACNHITFSWPQGNFPSYTSGAN